MKLFQLLGVPVYPTASPAFGSFGIFGSASATDTFAGASAAGIVVGWAFDVTGAMLWQPGSSVVATALTFDRGACAS